MLNKVSFFARFNIDQAVNLPFVLHTVNILIILRILSAFYFYVSFLLSVSTVDEREIAFEDLDVLVDVHLTLKLHPGTFTDLLLGLSLFTVFLII